MAEEYLKVFNNKKVYCEAIFSRTLSKSKTLKKKYNIKKIYKSLGDLKNDSQINALIIAVSAESIYDLINNLDIKKYRVLCEKPVGINFEETKKIITKIRNKHFYVALNRRFYSSNLKAHDLVNKNTLGTIMYAEGHFSHDKLSNLSLDNWRTKPEFAPAAGMTGMGVHLTDLMIWLFGPVKSVFASTAKKSKFAKLNGNENSMTISGHGTPSNTLNILAKICAKDSKIWITGRGWQRNNIKRSQPAEIKK